MSHVVFEQVKCPVSHELMVDPVQVFHKASREPEDPHIFDRESVLTWKEGKVCLICGLDVRKIVKLGNVLKLCKTYVVQHPEEFAGKTFQQIQADRILRKQVKQREVVGEPQRELPRRQIDPEVFCWQFSHFVAASFTERLLRTKTPARNLAIFNEEVQIFLDQAPLTLTPRQKAHCQAKIDAANQYIRRFSLSGPNDLTDKSQRCRAAGNFPAQLKIGKEMHRLGRLVYDEELELYFGDPLGLAELESRLERLELKVSKKFALKDRLFLKAKWCFQKSRKFFPVQNPALYGALGSAIGLVCSAVANKWIMPSNWRMPRWQSFAVSTPATLIPGIALRIFRELLPSRFRQGLNRVQEELDFLEQVSPVVVGAFVSYAMDLEGDLSSLLLSLVQKGGGFLSRGY